MYSPQELQQWAYTGVVGLKNGHLDALLSKEALGLSQIERRMVRRCVPILELVYFTFYRHIIHSKRQTLPVGKEGDLVSRHFDVRYQDDV